jgi:peptidoglycan L-alanyl-D-glutamate endopeptidase CwlK
MNSTSQLRLLQVYPGLAKIIWKMSGLLQFDIEVTSGLRTYAEQDALYAQGRTEPGEIVTNAQGGYSWHNFGMAADLVPEDITVGEPDWNLAHPAWQRLVSVAESLGLVSGAEWAGKELDTPHVQMTGVFPVVPTNEVRTLFTNGGSVAVWRAAFQIPTIVKETQSADNAT